MPKETKIQWTDFSWNPWQGCRKVSPGCKYCYMYRDKAKYGQDPRTIVRSADVTFNKPLKIKEPKRIFTCSWSDFFIREADEWRNDAWEIIRKTPHLTYQILTKRPERISIPADIKNILVGVSVESKDQLIRIPIAKKNISEYIPLFVSFEPVLEDVSYQLQTTGFEILINWMIIGGESGNDNGDYRYRPCKIKWIENLAALKHAGIPIFVKQLGTHLAKEMKLKDRHGGNIDEWPEELRIREFPI